MSSAIHQNDIGTQIVVTILDTNTVVDISTATDLKIIIRKPDTTILTKTAVLNTDGTDGKMVYTITSGDVDIVGHYKIQGKVELDGATFYSSISSFKVHCNI